MGGFFSASGSANEEIESRKKMREKMLRFGVDFLDDALRGIFKDDLILLGAPSGQGKTQMCCNIALANLLDGKKVYYLALEAGEFEIERRLKYPLVMERYWADPDRPRVGKIEFSDWLTGDFLSELDAYEKDAAQFFEAAYRDLFLYYKADRFALPELIEAVTVWSDDADLIIIDHVHYFDFDDQNENRAIKEIAKTVRTLAIENQKPIILVAHLRKTDRRNEDLVAGLDEFHGSSDLYKIATRVITLSSGRPTTDGEFETFFRIPKNRFDGGVTRFLARELFSPKKGGYLNGKYTLGWAEQKRADGFAALDIDNYPGWAKNSGTKPRGSNRPSIPQDQRRPYAD